MHINDAYPSKYLGAADLAGRPAVVKIDRIEMELIDKQKKMIISFVGKRKTMVCNKTNAKKIAEVLRSDETDHWIDQLIELYPAEVEFQGDTVEAIRVRAPRTETRSSDRGEPARRDPPREREREPDRISSGLDRRDDRGASRDPEPTRAYDRETDERPRDPPPRRAASDMNDDIPF